MAQSQWLVSLLAKLAFWIKTTAALGLCIWVAFELSITMAASTAVTVLILSDPDSGAVFAKSKWRLIGTMSGGIIFVCLAIPFIQAPWLLLLGLAIWSGICFYVSCYFRYFQAYAALLAGYTATIILGEVTPGGSIVTTTIQRVAEVCLGVLSVAFVFGLTHIRKGIVRLEPDMHLQARRIFEMVDGMTKDPTAQTQVSLVRQWVKQTDALQRKLLMLGSEETIHAKQSKSIRLALMDLFAPIAQFSQDFLALVSAEPTPAMLSARQAVVDCLEFLLTQTNNPDVVMGVIEKRLPLLLEPLNAAAQEIQDTEQKTKILSITTSLEKLLLTLHIYRRTRQDPSAYPIRKFGKILEQRISVWDSVGVGVCYLLFCAVCIGLEWDYWLISLQMYVAVVMLQLSNDRPVTNVTDMFKGLVLVAIIIYPIKFLLLPVSSEFGWLLFCVAIMLLPICWLRTSPKYMSVGSGGMLFGSILIGLNNEMTYDINHYLNTVLALAICCGGALATIGVIHPWRGETRLNMLMELALTDFENTINSVLSQDKLAITFWEDRQFARIRQLDHIVMLRTPEQANDAGRRLIHLVELIRLLEHEMALADQTAVTDTKDLTSQMRAELERIRSGHQSDVVGAKAADIADRFQYEAQNERANAWQSIADNMQRLEKHRYT